MYIGDTKFDLKNLSKNQRRELRELKRLYDEAVASGLKPKSPLGKYSREDSRGRVTKQQLEKLQKISYKSIYQELTMREQLEQKGLGKEHKHEMPKSQSIFKYHPELQIISGGQILDTNTGEIFKDMNDYLRKSEQDFKNKVEDALKNDKTTDKDRTTEAEPPRIGDTDYETGEYLGGDEDDAIKVDNFVDTVSPSYVNRSSSKSIKDAADLATTIRNIEHEYGTKAAAQMIDSIPSDIMGKIQSSNSKERYEADQQALEFAYEFLFSHTYDAQDEEWVE